MKAMSAYMRVVSHLQAKIATGIYPANSQLPTEAELEIEYNVSRTTVRKALELLRNEGMIYIRHGQGTFVRPAHGGSQSLNRITSFSETIKRMNKGVLKSRVLDMVEVGADSECAGRLEVEPGEPVFVMRRISYINDQPIAYMKNILLKRVVPTLDAELVARTSLYNYLETILGIRMESALDRIAARAADREMVELLRPGITLGEPVLVNNRLTFTIDRPFEIVYSVIKGSEYEYSIMMHGRPFTASGK